MRQRPGAPRPDPVQYMLDVARTPAAMAYKTYVAQELALAPGLVVADLGCGPATDLLAIVSALGRRGLLLGIDIDQRMLAAAGDRTTASRSVQLMAADGHALPLRAASLDRVRIDRALQHMAGPEQVLTEIRRTIRGGGRVVVAEPDWGTFVIDADRHVVSRAFVDYTTREVVRNAFVGRQVGRLGRSAGFVVSDIVGFPTVIRDFTTADEIFGLTRNSQAACLQGDLDPGEASAWLDELRTGPTMAAVTLFVTTLTVPAG